MIDLKKGLAALLVTQGDYKFYVVAMPSEDLRDTCFTITRDEDEKLGFQRRVDEERVEQIAKYIDEDEGSIPTAIILSAQEEANLTYNSKSKTIGFTRDSNAFLIIDGQHRVFGYGRAKKSIRVPVVIYEGLSRVDEAKLFVDINSNQKEVPEDLILDVKRLLQRETDEEKRCSDIFELFYKGEDSVLKGHLARAEKQNGKIARRVFNKAISDLINGTLVAMSEIDCYKIINNYLRAIQQVFVEMDTSLEGQVCKPVIFHGLMFISQHVVERTVDRTDGSLTIEAFYATSQVLRDNISPAVINRSGTSYKKFAERVLNGLSTRSIRPGLVTVD